MGHALHEGVRARVVMMRLVVVPMVVRAVVMHMGVVGGSNLCIMNRSANVSNWREVHQSIGAIRSVRVTRMGNIARQVDDMPEPVRKPQHLGTERSSASVLWFLMQLRGRMNGGDIVWDKVCVAIVPDPDKAARAAKVLTNDDDTNGCSADLRNT